ncbi:protein of unknown function (plasmid) [Paraburkholderia dioscoreae]|uniref:Uncharacterized protein n=1 Tax=Paraburkholderia dioscoreae TaxID=2604047 RepID=A0A5Q4ZQG6_9BURK|nr:protein of unknown function [Paraburkholderia dioscoreae]
MFRRKGRPNEAAKTLSVAMQFGVVRFPPKHAIFEQSVRENVLIGSARQASVAPRKLSLRR